MRKTMYFFDEVGGYGITAAKFRLSIMQEFAKGVREFVIFMISPGGDVLEASGIVDCIREHQKLGVRFIGINACYLASAGMTIASVMDSVYGTPKSEWLIHHAWALNASNYKNIDKVKEALQKASEDMIDIYVERTGKSREEIDALMDREEFISLTEAIEFGLVDGVYEGVIPEMVDASAGKLLNKLQSKQTQQYTKHDMAAKLKTMMEV